MNNYDVVIVGGSIAGSVAARYLAQDGFKVLMVESARTPREKPCSAIQFKYFRKIIGKKIPKNKLCTNPLKKLRMEFPSGRAFKIPMKMLNFTRDVFDSWLNTLAMDAGVEFRDATRCTDFEQIGDKYKVYLQPKKADLETVETRYLIAADGLSSTIRKKIRTQDYYEKGKTSPGITLNYYIKPEDEGLLNENCLYQFWNMDFCNLMFAWVYKKNDLWVVGTGYTEEIVKHTNLLLEYVAQKFKLKGPIVKKEGFATQFKLDDLKHVYLGEKNLIFIGDAAGLVDLHRGLGMDAAALSGRRLANAIIKGEKKGKPAIDYYKKSMKRLVRRININMSNQLRNLKTNEDLKKFMRKNVASMGIKTLFCTLMNKLLPSTRKFLLPR